MRICENCYKRHWRAKINPTTGLQVKHKNGNKVFICIFCGHAQEEEHLFIPPKERIKANILYIHLEISKSVYYNYGAKVPSKYLRTDDLIQENYMLGWAASYMGNDRVWSQFVTPQAAKAADESGIVKRLWELMDAAEIIAGHNVDGFDIKHCNTKFDKHGLPPIVDKKTIDTLKIARSKHKHESNTLDYLSQWYGLSGKEEVTDNDWKAAMSGDKKALNKAEYYCRNDVIIGKGLLDKFLPIANKPFRFGAIKKETYENEK